MNLDGASDISRFTGFYLLELRISLEQKVLVLSFSSDEHLSLVLPHLGATEFVLCADKPFVFDFDPLSKIGEIRQDQKLLHFSEIGSIWNRRAFTIPGNEQPHQRFTRFETRACVLQPLINSIPFQSWVNHPYAVDGARDKLVILEAAKACGFQCPNWIVSNKADVVIDFVKANGGNAVLKPVSSVPESADILPSLVYAKSVSEGEIVQKLAGQTFFPLFVQQQIDKCADWRITVIDGYIQAVRMTGCPPQTIDFRRAYDFLSYESRVLDTTTSLAVKALLDRLQLRYGAIDMVEDARSSELFFLEINPAGQFGWMEQGADLGGQCHFSKHLAEALLKVNPSVKYAPPEVT